MPTLPGIQSIPNGTPTLLRGFLTQLRERALATVFQFTDAEVVSLRKLLRTPQAAAVTTTTSTSVNTVFLDEPYEVYEGVGDSTWKKVTASDAGVPSDAVAVVVEARWTLFGKVGNDQRYACFRIDASKGNGSPIFEDTFIITSGCGGSDSNVDGSGGFTQGLFPLAADGTFEYLPNIPGLGWTNIMIRIIGYQAAS